MTAEYLGKLSNESIHRGTSSVAQNDFQMKRQRRHFFFSTKHVLSWKLLQAGLQTTHFPYKSCTVRLSRLDGKKNMTVSYHANTRTKQIQITSLLCHSAVLPALLTSSACAGSLFKTDTHSNLAIILSSQRHTPMTTLQNRQSTTLGENSSVEYVMLFQRAAARGPDLGETGTWWRQRSMPLPSFQTIPKVAVSSEGNSFVCKFSLLQQIAVLQEAELNRGLGLDKGFNPTPFP